MDTKNQNNTDNFLHEIGRIVAGGFYDYQEVRLSAMNRLRGIVRTNNEGIDLSKPEEKKQDKKFDKKYNDSNIFPLLTTMKKDAKISDEEHAYIQRLESLFHSAKDLEKNWCSLMDDYMKQEKIYTQWLSEVRGISTILTANLLKEFGYCETYKYVSSLWKHSGLHVINGKAPKRKKGEKLDYNPKLRTLCWKIADSFIKQRTPYYRDLYDREKERQLKLMEEKTENAPKRPLHAELRARRKMVKHFLAHYWFVARNIKGNGVKPLYVEEKLGHKNIIMPKFDEKEGRWSLNYPMT